ncbi:MAG: carbohydrate kinase [Schaedlerella sp.]|nr:carbohydrate kinase [Schaedlerella sp.]
MEQNIKKYDVIALGELLIDFAVSGKSEQGNQYFEACPGGAPCNVLAMLNKLGKTTAFIGKVGRDQFGRLLKSTIEEIGIDTKGLLMDEEVNTTLAFVHTFSNGDRDFSFYRKPGADMMLKEEDIDYNLIRQAKIFHLGTLSMTDEPVRSATKKALDAAKKSGCLISFDPNLRPPLWKTLDLAKEMMEYGFGYCDILKISDNEIQFVSGKEDYDEGIEYLQNKYNIPLILLTLGKDGSRAYYKGMRVEQSGFKVKTIETTGAGDTFCGSALSGILDYGLENLTEEALKDILKFSNAAAAVVTTKKGAIRSMPDPEEVKELMKQEK